MTGPPEGGPVGLRIMDLTATAPDPLPQAMSGDARAAFSLGLALALPLVTERYLCAGLRALPATGIAEHRLLRLRVQMVERVGRHVRAGASGLPAHTCKAMRSKATPASGAGVALSSTRMERAAVAALSVTACQLDWR